MDVIKVYANIRNSLIILSILSAIFQLPWDENKCAILKMLRGRFEKSRGIVMLIEETMGVIEKEQRYKYSRILEEDEIKIEETNQMISGE